jgi:Amino acid:DNA transferase
VRRQCDILGIEEERELRPGLDFRLPQYRREVFLRFYQFHLEHRAHPGGVYFAIPWVIQTHKLDEEQKFWLAFLNGNTQNIITTWLVFKRFPTLQSAGKKLKVWFGENYSKLEWDTDRRYHKKDFLASVECYRKLTSDRQVSYFRSLEGATPADTFESVWKALRNDFYTFGRLSSFSYSEYLRIIGYEIECNTLFLHDLEGSKSHRNGLAKVLGRDDRDWHKSGTFDGKYPEGEIEWLEKEADILLAEAKARFKSSKKVPVRDVGFFTLESTFCTYKSWHRKNRRYPNCYSDMMYNRIRRAERFWDKKEIEQFWTCRADCLPEHLLLECCPNDPGLCSEKQNHYRETGQPIMMSKRFPEFDNPFDRRVWLR